jgi:hypothetical protein
VHADDSTDFFRFERREEMWCCRLRPAIKAMIEEQLRPEHLQRS